MASEQKQVLDMFQRPFQRRRKTGMVEPGSFSTEMGIIEAEEPESVSNEVLIHAAERRPWQRLTPTLSISKDSIFSMFVTNHRLAAKELSDFFMEARNMEELRQMAEEVQEDINEKLYIFALSFVILRKEELRSANVRLPSIVEVFPSMFVPKATLSKMEERAKESIPGQEMVITEYGPEFSSTHLKPEHRVAYFREDYGINAHHWHWHLVYPVGMGVRRDRKGELFFYMHQQMLARYDMDRLSVGLNRVEKLSNWRIPIPDGYFSKLTINNSEQAWGCRQDNTLMQDLKRDGMSVDIYDLEQWHSRILGAIHQGFFLDRDYNQVKLSDEVSPPQKRGIEFLGDVLESDSSISVNSLFYGDLHNMGHMVLAGSHDPDYAHMENYGVMSETATAMRDPVFYRWHKYIDDIFQEYKQTQQPYTIDQLSLSSVEVASVEVESQNQKNKLITGWNTRDFEASRGLDFNSKIPVMMRITHLDHHPFNYSIKVINNHHLQMKVTVRIFMAPKQNERGVDMDLSEQRLLWAEMDRFRYKLNPGENTIVQSSTSSSIINSNDYTFRDLEESPVPANPDLCGCGWPQHMLLPRGKQEGMPFQLFVMVTDWTQDKVIQPGGPPSCTTASSFCGIVDALYPDGRPMGFPFDRPFMPRLFGQPLEEASDLGRLSNIGLQDITITFSNVQI